MTKFLTLVGLFITLQLAENQYEVIAQSHPLSVQKRSDPSLGPVGGIAIKHPLQATVYAHRQGLMKLLVPFEITIVPLAGGGVPYPEVPTNGYPISGQVKPQQDVSHLPYNRNTYRQYPSSQFGPSYYPPASYRYSYPSYNPSSYNSYNGYNQQYRNPYYGVPARRVDISHTKPWPQYRPTQQVKPVYNAINATHNWSGNNSAINISSLVNNVTHPPNASAPTAITTTTAPGIPQPTTLPANTAAATSTTTSTIIPEPMPEVPTDVPLAQSLEKEASYIQPIFVPPNLALDGTILPNEMNFNGEYSDRINGN
ncbi:uncharacterized protein LOC129571665 [Sitodiplosis mosellana]|uniref:uncharacterized protein LOC129571665 n=1 Tax=Sitodiplosis mosellana TaxID=263140 RepID=UPI002443964E|nr:uncharacterized protein LOC129571665 [Sitodiplosis mosellana]